MLAAAFTAWVVGVAVNPMFGSPTRATSSGSRSRW